MRTTIKRLLSVQVLGVALSMSQSLFAQETPDKSTAPDGSAEVDAARHFEQGVELYRDGALDAALIEFERAYELVRDYRVLYNLGRVQVERQRFAEAVELFSRYLAEGGAKLSVERSTVVRAELQKLRGRVAKLWVEANLSGARLFVDDIEVGTLPLQNSISVNPGIRHIVVRKPGYIPATHNVKVAGGESSRISLQLVAEGSTDRASKHALEGKSPLEEEGTDKAEAGERRNYTPFWVSFGATAVLGAGATTFGLLALNRRQNIQDKYDVLPVDRNGVQALRSEGKVFAAVADGLMIGTAVAAGITIYFAASPPKHKEHADSRPSGTALRLTTGLSSVSLSGQF